MDDLESEITLLACLLGKAENPKKTSQTTFLETVFALTGPIIFTLCLLHSCPSVKLFITKTEMKTDIQLKGPSFTVVTANLWVLTY